MTTTNTLATAQQRARVAQDKFGAISVALARARQVASEARDEANRLADEERAWIERQSKKVAAWIEAGARGLKPEAYADAKATLALASARANAEAAASALRQFEAAERAAIEVQNDAFRAVMAASNEALATEIAVLHEAFKAELPQFMRRRAQLLAAFIVMPGALSHREWSRVGHLPIATAAEMGISVEAFAHDIDYNPRPQRADVNAYEQALRERLAQLRRGDDLEPAAPTQVAA